jgi:transcriptional regulator
MYVPKQFSVTDNADIVSFVDSVRLGVLVTHDDTGFSSTHIPWLIEGDLQPGSTIACHVARVNPHWRRLRSGADALVIFSGPDAYVSPSWYPSKAEHGRAVPTWAYQAVHIEGRAEIFEDAIGLEQQLRGLSDVMEAPRSSPWKIEDAPRDFFDKLVRAIVGIRLTISKVEAQYKLEQNKGSADQAGAAAGLAAENSYGAHVLANIMRDQLTSR